MEHLLSAQPFLLGERFTLADASAYGQLGMNLVDPQSMHYCRTWLPALFGGFVRFVMGNMSAGTGNWH